MSLDASAPGNDCNYFNVAKHHGWFTATCQHETTTCFQHGFLPWHRVYMYEMEQAMRAIDSTIFLPYWDFTSLYSPSPDTPVQELLPSIVTEMFYVNATSNKSEWNPLYTYTIPTVSAAPASPDSPINISRNTGNEGGQLDFVRELVCSAFLNGQYDIFSKQYECPHNLMHLFQGGYIAEYTASSQRWAAFDPLFWFYHANIDRIWAGWEEQNPDTSAFLSKETTFYPFFNWKFEEITNYKTTMYYTYDSTFTPDFCTGQPQAGEYALYAHFTQLPISTVAPYGVRLIVDPLQLTGNSNANSNLTSADIVAEIVMWRSNENKCTSPSCHAWCPSPALKSNVQRDNIQDFYSKPFDVSNALFVDVFGKGRDPIDLSSGIRSSDLRSFLDSREDVLNLPNVGKPQLAYGKVLTTEEYAATAKVSEDGMSAFIHWDFQSPGADEYPPIKVTAGATLVFNYYVSDHSVAQVFENEFKECPDFIQPQCSPRPGESGKVNCTIILPAKVDNTTFFFICTESDHCGTRGMRIQIKIGDGLNVVRHFLMVITTDCPTIVAA